MANNRSITTPHDLMNMAASEDTKAAPTAYSLEELGGPFAKNFAKNNTELTNRRAPAFRTAQREVLASETEVKVTLLMPIAVALDSDRQGKKTTKK